MRKINLFFIATIVLSMFLLSASSVDSSKVTVTVNGDAIHFDVEPFIENGRVLVPARAIMEALGAEVSWDNATRTVSAKKSNTIIELTIDSCSAKVNNEEVVLDVPAKIKNGRTFVPLRFLSEHLDADVQWDNDNRCVTILQKEGNTSQGSVSVPSITFENKEISLLGDRLFIKMPKGSLVVGDNAIILEAEKSTLTATDTELININEQSICFGANEIVAYSTGNLMKDAERYYGSIDEKIFDYCSIKEYKTKSGIDVILINFNKKIEGQINIPIMEVLVRTPDNTLICLSLSVSEERYSQKEKIEKNMVDIIDTLRYGTKILNFSEREETVLSNKKITIAKDYVMTSCALDGIIYDITKVGVIGEEKSSMSLYEKEEVNFSEKQEGYSDTQITRKKGTILGKPVEWLYYENSPDTKELCMKTLVKLDHSKYLEVIMKSTSKEDIDVMRKMAESLR